MITPEELDTTDREILHPDKLPPGAPGKNQCVLLAEDDPALRRYLQVVLERAGYRVVSAADGLEAMKFLLSATVDVVVTDAVMPNLDGYQLCRFMRSSKHLSHLPVILLSALDPRNATHESEQVDVFLSKPVSPEDLLSSIVEVSHR
ncbi:MAG TPA: response regulator [Pyrinomonadaceae bacterium]|nr:response regulator [Pyrinomonadaceae bacterium]